MKLLIVTGMSGAGKSQAANALEDMGYYCVDNIPPAIIPSFVEFSKHGAEEMVKLAIVTDIRGGNMFEEISNVLEKLKKDKTEFKILFLDASNDVIIRRHKENRRKHPCEREDVSLSKAVEIERQKLETIRKNADYIIDTSLISISQLKSELTNIFLENQKSGLTVNCRSFGYKYGIDSDADIVIDVRCLRNPFYVKELKHKTGLDKEVAYYVMDSKDSEKYKKKLFEFIDFSIPLYAKEGKSNLVISFGCTGGKHRSVTFAEMLAAHLKEKGYYTGVMHRDISKK